MPAPLAKGIILLSSILVAAGIAAYENPEVRAWFEERRRKIALTINDIADELDPQRAARRRRFSNDDVSTREDNSSEAVERRRRVRRELYERGIMLDQRRRTEPERTTTASSFDEMVDDGGKLRSEQTTTTGHDANSNEVGIRNRLNNTQALALGSMVANPFDDELGGVIQDRTSIEQDLAASHENTRILDQAIALHVDTNVTSITGPEELGNLTPTTSVAASTLLSAPGIMTPTSTTHPQSDHQGSVSQNQQAPAQSYQSIQEWASAASSGPASFYSPPESERNYQNMDSSMLHTPSQSSSVTASIIGTNDLASEGGDLDTLSDLGNDTPSTWSEIGSQVSED